MKALLYAAVEQAPSGEVVEPEVVSRYFAKFDEQFFHYCDKELTKMNTFYSGIMDSLKVQFLSKINCLKLHTYKFLEKLAEATRKYASLRSELLEAHDNEFKCKEKSRKSINHARKILGKRDVPARKIQELKLAFSEFYLSLILLQNYQNLNFTGFRKILKKHDKV